MGCGMSQVYNRLQYAAAVLLGIGLATISLANSKMEDVYVLTPLSGCLSAIYGVQFVLRAQLSPRLYRGKAYPD